MEKSTKISPFRLTSLLRLQQNPNLALKLFQNTNPNLRSPKPYRYSYKSYDLIICKLGKSKNFPQMEQILDQLLHESPRFIPKETLFCHVISFYGRAHMAAAAIRTFDRIPSFRCDRSIRSFNSLLNALLNCRDFEKISNLCRNLEFFDLMPDACTYNILIRASNSLDYALKLFDEMRMKGIEPSVVTFGTLINSLCNNLKLDKAFKLKEEMLRLYNVRPNVYIYTTLIKALCNMGDLEKALTLKEEMVGLEFDSAVYSTIIRGLFKAGQKDGVVGVLEEMKQSGVKPDVVTYNAMIAGFCDGKEFDNAFGVMSEMERNGIKLDVVSYNTIISGFCKEGRWRDAVEVFEDMPRRGCKPDVMCYRMVFEGLCGGGEFGEARLVLDEMLFKGYLPGVKSMEKFVEGLSKDGEWAVVVEVLCRLSTKSEIFCNAWEVVVNQVMKEEMVKVGEFVDCLISR